MMLLNRFQYLADGKARWTKWVLMTYSAIRSVARIWLWRMIGRIAFNRIEIVGKQHLQTTGPLLFVATHRNGALDAAPYIDAESDADPVVSAQLHRLPLGRLLFQGISVSRAKDRDRDIEADNMAAMQECIRLLESGGQLLVMPEGTSKLGFKHLPFHRGAAQIVKAAWMRELCRLSCRSAYITKTLPCGSTGRQASKAASGWQPEDNSSLYLPGSGISLGESGE